jgi:hypothetical protein
MRKLLAQSAYWTLNKHVAKALKSNDAALLIAELLDIHDQHPERDMVWRKQQQLMDSCNLTITGLRNAMNILKDKNLIYVEKKSNPAKNYYKVLEDNVDALLSSGKMSTSDQPRENDKKPSGTMPSSDKGECSHNNKHNNNQITNNQGNNSISYKEWINSLSNSDKDKVKNLSEEDKKYIFTELSTDEEKINYTKYQLLK